MAFAMVFSAALAPAQEGAQIPGASAAPPGPQPKIEIDNPLFDFGTALEGTTVHHTWKIKNTGNGRLIIRGVKTSCGCTAAAPTKTILAPGEEAAITAGFDTRFQKGHQERSITAMTNDPDTPQAIMTIQGVIKQQVAATPSDLAFDVVKHGTEVTKSVLISDLTNGPDFRIASVSNSNPAIKVVQEKRPDGKPGTMLKVSLTPSMPVGQFDDTIKIVTNRIPIQVEVFGTVSGDLSIDPAQVSFGIVPRGQEAIRIIKLTNQGQKPVKVLGITSNAVAVSASAQPVAAGKEYKITVQLRGGTPDGQVRGQLQITTDDPEQQTLNVPFYGIVGKFEI